MISEEPLGRNLQTKLGGKQRQKMLLFLLMMGSSAAVPPEFKKNFNKRPSCKAVPLTRWKQNKPDSAACVWFLFLSFPLNLVIILHRAERKPSVAGESILTRQLSKPLGTGGHRGEPHHRWRPRRPDC